MAFTGSYTDLINLPVTTTGSNVEGGGASTLHDATGLNIDGGASASTYTQQDLLIDGGGAT